MFRLEEAIEKAKSVELPEAEYGSSKFSYGSVIEQRIWKYEMMFRTKSKSLNDEVK